MKNWFFLLLLIPAGLRAQTNLITVKSTDSISAHPIRRDAGGSLLGWYRPEVPGAAYDHVCRLASEFIKSGTPVENKTGLKMYLVTCCFEGPHMRPPADFAAGKTGEGWMHNPACVYAGMVQSLVLDWRVYSGDASYIDVVRGMLDYQLKNGTTPAGWVWASVPYASADPFEKTYQGATKWETDGMRGDGLHGVEPDKIGELGYAYLKFYQVTGDKIYRQAALNCADALAKNCRKDPPATDAFALVKAGDSPWPFRVNARTGLVADGYTANVIEPIRLFDELLRTGDRIALDTARSHAYERARQSSWNWLFSKTGPLKTFMWSGYFEDVPNDPHQDNRVNNIPLETARYLLKNPHLDPAVDTHAEGLIRYVRTAFGEGKTDAINEQLWCYVPMASHTARYASLCALWYERTGDELARQEAYRYFNWATYATDPNGVVRVGPTWPGTWFSDGYGDYIKHFMEGMAAVPAWAPAGENHLLRSSSVVQTIDYGKDAIRFKTYDPAGSVVLRLKAKPRRVRVGGRELALATKAGANSWMWQALPTGGVARLTYSTGNEVVVEH